MTNTTKADSTTDTSLNPYEKACYVFDYTNASPDAVTIATLRFALFDCWYDGRTDDEGTRTLARAIAHLRNQRGW